MVRLKIRKLMRLVLSQRPVLWVVVWFLRLKYDECACVNHLTKLNNALASAYWQRRLQSVVVGVFSRRTDSDIAALMSYLAGQETVQIEAIKNDCVRYYLTAQKRYDEGRFHEVVAAVEALLPNCPVYLLKNIGLQAAYAAGLCRDTDKARHYFGLHYGLFDVPQDKSSGFPDQTRLLFDDWVLTKVRALLGARLVGDGRIGVFFLNSTHALGHAILDPYHFLRNHHDRFDKVFFIGCGKEHYRAPSRAAISFLEEYGEYVETTDEAMNNLSWMSLGEVQSGSLTLVINHYWGLLRETVLRTVDYTLDAWDADFAVHPPAAIEAIGRKFCRRHGIDLDSPLVVLHVREHAYHGIEKQAFRNASIDSYRLAINYLLDKGFTIVRVGDKSMQPLDMVDRRFLDLPFVDDYDHVLDGFFVSKCTFMIGCQSGPCAYARAFRRPLLSVNAVYHYTLIPSVRELAAFKRYFRDGRELSISELVDQQIYFLETSADFAEAGVTLKELEPGEILAAVSEMVRWVGNPDLPATPEQLQAVAEFRRAHREATERPFVRYSLADYVGMACPGYRVVLPKAAEKAAPLIAADA